MVSGKNAIKKVDELNTIYCFPFIFCIFGSQREQGLLLKSVKSGDTAQGAEWSRYANEEMKSLALLTNDVALVALIKGDTLAWKFLSRNDVCLRQMMLPAVMMSLTLMMCATHIVPANIASLRQELPLHHFGVSRYIIGASHQHHFFTCRLSFIVCEY